VTPRRQVALEGAAKCSCDEISEEEGDAGLYNQHVPQRAADATRLDLQLTSSLVRWLRVCSLVCLLRRKAHRETEEAQGGPPEPDSEQTTVVRKEEENSHNAPQCACHCSSCQVDDSSSDCSSEADPVDYGGVEARVLGWRVSCRSLHAYPVSL
jgi:hypothetical protein